MTPALHEERYCNEKVIPTGGASCPIPAAGDEGVLRSSRHCCDVIRQSGVSRQENNETRVKIWFSGIFITNRLF